VPKREASSTRATSTESSQPGCDSSAASGARTNVSPFRTNAASPWTLAIAATIAPPVPSGDSSRTYEMRRPRYASPKWRSIASLRWPTERITARMPRRSSASSCHSRNGRPATGAIGFGSSPIVPARRVPKPPARMMAVCVAMLSCEDDPMGLRAMVRGAAANSNRAARAGTDRMAPP